MPRYLEKPPRTLSPRLNEWLNNVHKALKSLGPAESLNVLTTRTAIGTARRANPPAKGAPAESWYQGEYSVYVAYTEGEGVKISTGLTAGVYIATRDIPMIAAPPEVGGTIADPSSYPWLGTYWDQIGRVVDQSNWI